MRGHAWRRAAVILAIAIASLAARGSAAAAETITLDPSLTSVSFTLGATMHTVDGTLAAPTGEIRFDRGTGEASGRLVIDARTARTGNDSRDRKMHEEILESARYPEIALAVRRVAGTIDDAGGSDLRLIGALEIHGAAHEVDIPIHVEISGGAFSGSAMLSVPYVAWGMKDPSVLVLRVKKVVEVTVRFGGRIAPPVTTAPP